MTSRLPERFNAVNWTAFELKSGDKFRDFEALCRTLVRLSFDGYGHFTGYRQQSGVEFALKLEYDHPTLGKKGAVLGWQCKYFRGKLTSAQFRQIEDSYNKTIRDYPNVATWILWTPECLAHKDQERVLGLRKGASRDIRLWHEDMVLALSSTIPCSYLLATYFGQYAFTDVELQEAFTESILPVSGRWKKSAHVMTKAEREVRRSLLETSYWQDDVKKLVSNISHLMQMIRPEARYKVIKGALLAVEECLEALENRLAELTTGRIIDNKGVDGSFVPLTKINECLKYCRDRRLRVAFPLQNLLHYLRRMKRLCGEMSQKANTAIIAVKALPGMGKTHLAISVAEANEHRPAGVMLLAKTLRKGECIDAFVRSLNFLGRTFDNLDALLNAIDAVGKKHSCVMPIVIDGLNESESPPDWRDIIALMDVKIKRHYQNVKVVVTYRGSEEQRFSHRRNNDLDYERFCVPNSIKGIEITNEGLPPMMQRYFDLYEITFNGSADVFKYNYFGSPLLLRVFCEINRGRTLTFSDIRNCRDIFQMWLDSVQEKICGARYGRAYILPSEYRSVLTAFSRLLWESGRRRVSGFDLDKASHTENNDWCSQWGHILVDEGLALGSHDNDSSEYLIEALHDQLGGYLISEHLWQPMGHDVSIFQEVLDKEHDLEYDILQFIVPKWMQMNQENDIVSAVGDKVNVLFPHIMQTMRTECNAVTRNKMWEYVRSSPEEVREYFNHVMWNATNGQKSFNGEALDEVLSKMTMVERDSVWGVWICNERSDIHKRLDHIFHGHRLYDIDDFCSIFYWCKWLLVSNIPKIRDLATHVICALGEMYPKKALELLATSLSVNDLFVLERLVAAGYGICIFLANSRNQSITSDELNAYANRLKAVLFAKTSMQATSHYGVLSYAVNTIALLTRNQKAEMKIVADPFDSLARITEHDLGLSSFATMGDNQFVNKDIPHMLGGGDYATNTPEYRRTYPLIEKRIYDLGYRNTIFEIDKDIWGGNYSNRYNDLYMYRFGKKYALIAYMEMKGCLDRQIQAWDRWHEINIDPTFPGPPDVFQASESIELINKFTNMRDWVWNGYCPDVGKLSKGTFFSDANDEWILVDGYIVEEPTDGRRLFIDLHGFLSSENDVNELLEKYYTFDVGARQFHYSFHGESPWSLNWRAPCYEPEWGYDLKLRPEMNDSAPYRENDGKKISMELLVVNYCWEHYHSEENQENGTLLGSYFANKMNLRIVPHRWEYVDRKGKVAARFCRTKTDSTRMDLFYIRRDVLERYARIRRKVFRIGYWGERQIQYTVREKYHSVFEGFKDYDNAFKGMLAPL